MSESNDAITRPPRGALADAESGLIRGHPRDHRPQLANRSLSGAWVGGLPPRPRPWGADEATRVLIVDDHRLYADVLRHVLQELGPSTVEIAPHGASAIDAARRFRPDLVLLDMSTPGTNGLEVGRTILGEMVGTRVVAMAASADPAAARQAIRAGFHGFITRDNSVEQFLSSVLAVLEGSVVVLHQLARRGHREHTAEELEAAVAMSRLTPREREVLALITDGLNNSGIAQRLSISANTVRTHTQNMMSKLQVHSRLEAAAYAGRHGVQNLARREAPA
jgi:two-component system nitrate/nitrite response regulator NarL